MSEENTENDSNKTPYGNGPVNGRKAPKIAALAVLLAALAYGAYHYRWGLTHEETDDAFLEGRVIPISARAPGHVLRVHVKDNQPVNAGDLLVEIDPRDYVLRVEKAKVGLKLARARASAALKTVDFTNVTSTSAVSEAKAGVEKSEAAVETVRKSINAAEARLEMASAQTAAAESILLQTKAQLQAAVNEEAFLKSDFKRYSDMFAKGIITAQQLEQTATAAKNATARVEAMKSGEAAALSQLNAAKAAERNAFENVAQIKSQLNEAATSVGQAKSRLGHAKGQTLQVGVTQSQADAFIADIEQAEAALKQAELELSYTRVTAPEAGRITKKSVEPGAFIQTGQALLALVPGDLWVVANFKETQLRRMRPGQPVSVRVDAYPDNDFEGRIDSIQTGTGARFSLLPPENATGNYVKVVQRMPVKITFDKPLPSDLTMGPGMSVTPVVTVQ